MTRRSQETIHAPECARPRVQQGGAQGNAD